MDPTASWQTSNAHHPDILLSTNYPLEPRILGQIQDFEAAFDDWLNVVPGELQLSSSCTDLTPQSVSEYVFLPSLELSPSPVIQTHLYDEPIANAAQQYSGVDGQISDFQAQRKPAKPSVSSCGADCSRDESHQQLSR